MPSAQSQFPLTLAEVLFEELTATSAPINEKSDDIARLKEKLTQIQNLCAEDQLPQICEQEKITIDPTAETPADKIWDCRTKLSRKLVPLLYFVIRTLPEKRAALCLSGGGVRSAVFNLGVLQGLARVRLLDKFDYLSTVSGGGFIGSWFSAWIKRDGGGVRQVSRRLASPPEDRLAPEPKPLYNLRVYANYLTPRKGLLGPDTWTLVAVYLRNLFLNWLVFVPVIAAFLMLPRLSVSFINNPYFSSPENLNILLVVGFLAAVIALAFIGISLPGSRRLNPPTPRFVILCLIPLVVSALALTTYWVRLDKDAKPSPLSFTIFAVTLGAIPWIIYAIMKIFGRPLSMPEAAAEQRKHPGGRLRKLGRYVTATVLIFVAFAITGFLTGYIVQADALRGLDPRFTHARLYAALAVPALLILLTLGGTLISGFTSRFTDVDDQEWWARSGAWILIVVIGWTAFHLLVLVGPSLLLGLQALIINKDWSQVSFKDASTLVVGIVSGAITLFGGSSSKTPANGEQAQASWKAKLLSIITSVAAVIFGAFIVILLAIATNWILASSLGELAGKVLGGRATVLMNANDPRGIVYQSSGWLLVVILFVLAVAGWVFGLFINTNRFSLHYYWRNRMMRAYLGVSRLEEEREATRNKFTDFDLKDNLQMYEVKQKPLHVVNLTLNLAGGHKLEWQDRKAESFSVSPLHSGSFWLGYRNSKSYGGHDGISLATSVAISGAAASPNMGYMMTSPIARFIMTLFNVRLGFWLGNPGVAGASTFGHPSPTQSVGPIVSEALGMTDDKSPYVYLSDGGHFDNFGLYEMILRRCRFIVVSDASTDPDYCFESLAYAIRQIRVDFGVPIQMREKMRLGRNPADTNSYCAIADIFYSAADGLTSPDSTYDGVLIYIKPSLNGSEPADVLNFHKSDDAFPQDTIVDQWFGEAQFESYRMLGAHMVTTICPRPVGNIPGYFDRFEDSAKKHLGLK